MNLYVSIRDSKAVKRDMVGNSLMCLYIERRKKFQLVGGP